MKCLVVLMLMLTHSLFGMSIQPSTKYPMFVFPNEISYEHGPLRIVNGQQASPNQFPYQVGLYIQQKLTQVFCGGSLISTRYVLTAAHCTEGMTNIIAYSKMCVVDGFRNCMMHSHLEPPCKEYFHLNFFHYTNLQSFLKYLSLKFFPTEEQYSFIFPGIKAVSIDVILGAYNISDSTETTRQRQRSVDYTNHPDWDRGSLTNDIAIIKLNTAVQVNDYIQTIALTSGDDTFAGYEGTVTGWGVTSDVQKTITDILRYESNPILSNDACKSVDENYDSVIQDTHLCLSGDGNKSICEGDSGGPLTTGNVQVGITSFNYQSCEAGKPSVFTRVSEFTQWIQDNSDVVIVR